MKLFEVIKAFTDIDNKIKTVGMIITITDNREDKLISQGYIVPLPTVIAESFLKQIRDIGIDILADTNAIAVDVPLIKAVTDNVEAYILSILAKFEDMLKEKASVPVTLNATVVETDILHLDTLDTRYILRELTLKSADPGADTVTVRLYSLVNDVLTVIDTFDITTANFATYFNLIDMFGLVDVPGDEIKVTVEASAGTYAITGQYSYALTEV